MRHVQRFLLTGMLFFLSLVTTTYAQEKKILTIPGEVNKPYEIIDAVAFVKSVEVKILSFGGVTGAYNNTLKEAFEDLAKLANKVGADAVINMQLQFVLSPGPKGKEQQVAQLLVFGTMVKFKSEPGK